MDPIDSVSRAVLLLRRRLAARPGQAEAAATAAADPAASATAPAMGKVRASIARRLRALDPQEPRFSDRATEAFLEGVLLAEFGSELINEPEFRQLILGVAREMRDDAQTAQQLDKLIETMRLE